MMSEPMCLAPASDTSTSAIASGRISVLNAMITLCRGLVDASVLRISLRLTLPILAILIGTSIALSSLAKASSPPTVSALMQTPSSSSSIESSDSSLAAASASERSESEWTTRRVVPASTPSKSGAEILSPLAAWASSEASHRLPASLISLIPRGLNRPFTRVARPPSLVTRTISSPFLTEPRCRITSSVFPRPRSSFISSTVPSPEPSMSESCSPRYRSASPMTTANTSWIPSPSRAETGTRAISLVKSVTRS